MTGRPQSAIKPMEKVLKYQGHLLLGAKGRNPVRRQAELVPLEFIVPDTTTEPIQTAIRDTLYMDFLLRRAVHLRFMTATPPELFRPACI